MRSELSVLPGGGAVSGGSSTREEPQKKKMKNKVSSTQGLQTTWLSAERQQSPVCRRRYTSLSSCLPCRRSLAATCLSAGSNTANCCQESPESTPSLSNTGASNRCQISFSPSPVVKNRRNSSEMSKLMGGPSSCSLNVTL
ncbi:uncharacterized protein [Paralichthys olivaceus]|uniref:uncharacterized protein isoform X4 n=1 Tax=Paralichthys olivaceus TaxID=8255 RepID=UPI0037528F27